jgi:hypothetical protein
VLTHAKHTEASNKYKPEEVGDGLEVGASDSNLVNNVLDGADAELAERLLDDSVVAQRDALSVDLAVTALVDQLADRLEVRLAVKLLVNMSSPSTVAKVTLTRKRCKAQ